MENNLIDIINKTNKEPTIVNENSKFVVVTYYWGTGNYNQNTARPCISFFEIFINQIINLSVKYLNTVKNYNETLFLPKILLLPYYYDIINKKSIDYINMIYEYSNIKNKNVLRDNLANAFLKQNKLTPENFEYKNVCEVSELFNVIMKIVINLNKNEIFDLHIVEQEGNLLKSTYLNKNINTDYKNKIEALHIKKKDIKTKIKTNLNNSSIDSIYLKELKSIKPNANLDNLSIFKIFNLFFRFVNPIKFEDMISNWEKECSKNGCNFLSVEYPEFAKPGGYQLAINAKPLFIKKALDLCKGRGVLYIDGDMYIRKYPSIFDMSDVDFMARGWWIDPRASDQFNDSIMYDPYTFETSGGTMFFSQSDESKALIHFWIKETDKIYQKGKADDRILSLIFNTYKLLLPMKIIQLPIEYLWLTLSYNDYMLDSLYDSNFKSLNETIFIEHPECLTSEETASNAGASSDRKPKFYSFLDMGDFSPVSEEFHEYTFFPNKEMTETFQSYFKYMNNTTYLNDGNSLLYDKQFVDINNPENNLSPLYVINYDDKFGNKKINIDDELLSRNDIVDINLKRANNINLDNLISDDVIKFLFNDTYVEILNKNNELKKNKLFS